MLEHSFPSGLGGIFAGSRAHRRRDSGQLLGKTGHVCFRRTRDIIMAAQHEAQQGGPRTGYAQYKDRRVEQLTRWIRHNGVATAN
jgi:hypothetical protein